MTVSARTETARAVTSCVLADRDSAAPPDNLGRPEQGFTLLEVLVSVAVFGLLLVALGQGTQFALVAHGTMGRQIAANEDLDAVDHALRHLVGTMDPGWADDPSPHFAANARSMGFIAALPAMAWSRTRQADVVVAVDSAHRLVLRWAPHYPALLGPPPTPQVTPLLNGVDHIELSYWDPGGGHGGWVDRWNGRALPELIRIRIVFQAGDRRHWPDIVAATAAG